MKVIRIGSYNASLYDTDLTDIREVAMKYGHSNDVVELLDDNNNMVAVAVWFQGDLGYSYSYGSLFNVNPALRQYVY